jgi:hypothetical protein
MSRFEAISLDIEGSRDELPLGLGVNSVTLSGVRSQFLRAFGSLFYAGQPGHLALAAPQYCFADTAGTIPAVLGGQVARVNSPVPGQPYLVQETAAARLTMGRHPSGGIRNFATGAAAVNDTTYWASGTTNGVTRTIVATGVEAGEQYIDIRWQGTSTQLDIGTPYSIALSRTPATTGQVWTTSVRIQRIAGSSSGVSGIRVSVVEETAPATNVGTTTSATYADAALTTISATRTMTTGNQVRAGIGAIAASIGAVIDVTFRIRGLQFEQAATRSAYQANFGPFDVTEAGIDLPYYLQGDGVDDHMTTSETVNMSTLTKARLVAGLEKFTDVNFFYAVSHGLDASGGNLSIFKGANFAQWTARTRSFVGAGISTSSVLSVPAPDRAVLTADVNRTTDFIQARYNNAPATASTVALTGNMRNDTLAVLAQPNGDLPMNGRWYGHAYADMTDADLARVQQYFASKLGETLT